MSVRGLRVVVTGASGGLGPTLVESLLAMGASVVAVARRRTRLDDLCAALRRHDRLRTAECDVTDAAGVAALFAALERDAPIDGVLHAAGAFTYGRLEDLDPADLERLVRTNLISTALVVREAVRAMRPRAAGSVVVVAADRAVDPAPGFSVYGAAKAAAVHLVSAVARELAGTAIRVNALLPGAIDTEENRRAMPDAVPGRLASKEAIARAALFLLGSEGAGLSGGLVRIPGG